MVYAPLVERKMTIKKPIVKKIEKPEVEVVKIKKPEKVKIEKPEDKKEIKVIERIIESREIAPQDAFGKMTRSQISLIKRTVAKGASDDELKLFIQVCKGANLNPFLRQVFLVPRWDSNVGAFIRSIQVSIDGFRAIAEESGNYAGNDDAIFTGEESIKITSKGNKIVKELIVPKEAKVTVYKLMGENRYPFTATARWSEYYPGDKMGFMWRTKPHIMLGKCAEALALRKAFPKLLSGMYTQEELDKGQTDNTEEKKRVNGMQKLLSMLSTMKFKELQEYKGKIEKTTKYNETQKAELLRVVEDRFNEITKDDK